MQAGVKETGKAKTFKAEKNVKTTGWWARKGLAYGRAAPPKRKKHSC